MLRYREICRWGFVLIRSSFWDDFGDSRHMMLLRLHHSSCVLISSRAYLMLNQHQPKTTSLLLHGKWVMKFILCVCVCSCGYVCVRKGWKRFHSEADVIELVYFQQMYSSSSVIRLVPNDLRGFLWTHFGYVCLESSRNQSLQQTAPMSDLSTGLGIKFQNFYNVIRS